MIRCLSGIGRSYSESVRTISKSASVFLRASNRRSVKSSIEVMVLGFAAMGSPTPRLGFILLLLGYILGGGKELSHMHSLRDILQEAQNSGAAVGHFNISDLVLLKAAFAAARELKVPVIVGLSEGEREFVGTR